MAGRRAGASMPHPQDTWLFAHCQSQLLALCPGFQVYKPLQSQLWVPAGEGSASFLLRDQRHRQGYRDLLSSSRVGIGVGETRYSQHSSATKDCAYSHFPEGKGSQPRTQRQGGNRQGRNLTQAFSGSSRGLLGQSEEEGGEGSGCYHRGGRGSEQVLASSMAQPRAGSGRVPPFLPLS